MKNLNLYSNFNKKIFNENLKIYKESVFYYTGDHLVFDLVDKYINCDINVSNNNDETTLIDEKMLDKNKRTISYKVNNYKRSKRDMLYYDIINEFDDFKKFTIKYKKLLKYYDKHKNLSKQQNFELDSLMIKLTYLLIELKVNLNMPLDDISIENINSYCDCIAFDIINNNYKALSISEHIYDDQILLQKKIKTF